MLDKILRLIEKIIPKKIYRLIQPIYHFTLSYLSAVRYNFPSKHIKVVAVTGTKGKTSVTEILNTILETAGYKTALQNSIRFKIGNQSKRNLYKMSTPGRFFIQKFLHDSLKEKCDWVILEITSEAAKLYRNRYIELDAFIFTNLAPEHIESHGSYEAYREAKLSIANGLCKKDNTFIIVNSEDKEAKHFLKKEASKHLEYSTSDGVPFELKEDGVVFRIDKTTIYSKLLGKFNLENMLAAITFAREIGIADEIIKTALESIEKIPGRVEKIENNKGIDVYVDYAHTAESLEALYSTFPNKKLICVLGSTGGGRDVWKRAKMGETADKYCSHIILTNDDPYEEDPIQIVEEMKTAIKNHPVEIIISRREAIRKAISETQAGDVLLITGKGTDPYLMEAHNTKTPWDDAEVVREELEKLSVVSGQ